MTRPATCFLFLYPLFFGCWQARLLSGRRRPVYPQGKPGKRCGGNKRRRSAGTSFCLPQAPTQEGLDGVERSLIIRRTATKKRAAVFKNRGGHGGACGAGTTPNSRPRSGRPTTWCELASTRSPSTAGTPRIHANQPGIKKEPAIWPALSFFLRTGNLGCTVGCGLSTRLAGRRGCWR